MLDSANPHLAAIRSAVRALREVDARLAHDLESARFNVYAALEAGDAARARDWLNALDAALAAAETLPGWTEGLGRAVGIARRGLRAAVEGTS